jgi:cytolysin (calcineurin-like family phosphatase)
VARTVSLCSFQLPWATMTVHDTLYRRHLALAMFSCNDITRDHGGRRVCRRNGRTISKLAYRHMYRDSVGEKHMRCQPRLSWPVSVALPVVAACVVCIKT